MYYLTQKTGVMPQARLTVKELGCGKNLVRPGNWHKGHQYRTENQYHKSLKNTQTGKRKLKLPAASIKPGPQKFYLTKSSPPRRRNGVSGSAPFRFFSVC
jgi:hypothetical protein